MRLASAPPATANMATSWRGPLGAGLHSLSGGGPVHLLLLLVALAYIGAFVGTGLLRAIYPFPLDGLERGALQEVARIRAGQPLYVAPTLEYVPFIYGPLYYYAAALVATIARSDLVGLRGVSYLSSMGSIAVVALLIRRETGSLAMGVVGGGLLAASDRFVDGAMDLGRVDALAVFLLLATIYATRKATSEPGAGWRSSACGGALLGLALLTKQSAAPVAFALLLIFALTRRSRLLVYVLALGASVGLGLVLISLQTWPWPLVYLWELPRRHSVTSELAMSFWTEFTAHAAVPALVGPFFLVARALVGDRQAILFYAAVAVSMLAMAWITRSTIGGAANVELPAYAVTALLFGLGLDAAVSQPGSATRRARLIRGYVLGVGVGAFGVMLYNPRLWVPYRSDQWAQERLAATLGALPGPIFAGSYQGFLAAAPDAVAPDLAAVNEIQGERVRPNTAQGEVWDSAFEAALLGRRITYVIVDPDNPVVSVPVLTKDYGYVDVGALFPPGDEYWRWRTSGWTPRAEVYARPDLAAQPLPQPRGGGG